MRPYRVIENLSVPFCLHLEPSLPPLPHCHFTPGAASCDSAFGQEMPSKVKWGSSPVGSSRGQLQGFCLCSKQSKWGTQKGSGRGRPQTYCPRTDGRLSRVGFSAWVTWHREQRGSGPKASRQVFSETGGGCPAAERAQNACREEPASVSPFQGCSLHLTRS